MAYSRGIGSETIISSGSFLSRAKKKIIGRGNVMALLKFNYLQDLRNLAQTLQEAYIF